ncbi:MAG: pyridoxal phosphate-dependent aminotransferase [Bacteroidota bacterium]
MGTTSNFSEQISSLKESATLALAQRVRELKAEGRDVIGLTLGEPDFDTPQHIKDAAAKALADGHTSYPPVAGIPELRKAIADKLVRENSLDVDPSQIVVSTGAKQTLYNVISSLLNPGDEVILPAPYWVTYRAQLELSQANIKEIPTGIEEKFKLSPAALKAELTQATKLLILTTPSNPSGSMYSPEELADLVEVIEKYPKLYVIADEIYEHIVYDLKHVSIASFTSIKDRVITVNGFAKGFAMTGWRLGYMAANPEIVKLCIKLQGQVTSGANNFAQWGGVAALTSDLTPTFAMRDSFRSRRDDLYHKLKAIPNLDVLLPDGAFYFYPDMAAYLNTISPKGMQVKTIGELCLYLIEEGGVVVVPGSAFGTETHVRISYAYAVNMLNKAVDRLGNALTALTPL